MQSVKISPNINLKMKWQLMLVAVLCLVSLGARADAAPHGVDVFSVSTPLPSSDHKNKSNVNTDNNHDAVNSWFVKFDDLRDKYQPTDGDTVILTRPLMQKAERVQQWTNTASKISKNYLLLAKSIRSIPLPAGVSDVKEYRDLTADWYQDAASVYQELIRPRPPARTIEDLQEQLEAVKKRSESLAGNIATLKAMDRSLRQEHEVASSQDDIIQKFVKSK